MPENTVTLYYEEHGDGLPVIFLHGFPLDHTTWNPVVGLLQNHARLILPDLRGFGRSPATDDKVYSMRMMADDVLALMDHLEIERAVLVGHSMGGYVSLAFAHSYPSRLAGLGLIGTQAGADSPERRQNRMKQADTVKRRGMKIAMEGVAERYTSKAELVASLQARILQANPQAVIAALKGMAERTDYSQSLSTITVPALVLAGEKDQMVPPERSRTMNQLLAWSWMQEIPGAGHMMVEEFPELVADALHKFFHTVESNQNGSAR